MKKLLILILAAAAFASAEPGHCFIVGSSYIDKLGWCKFEKDLYDNSGRLTMKQFSCDNGYVKVDISGTYLSVNLTYTSDVQIFDIGTGYCATRIVDEFGINTQRGFESSDALTIEYAWKLVKNRIQK